MASIHLQGILVDSVGEIDVGGVITFTHLTTTGDTIASTQTELVIPPDGAYSIDVEYGQIRIDYTTRNTERFVANVIVNSASTATSLPELLSATTPVAKPIIIQMQGLVADAVTAEAGAVAAAATTATRKDTFTNLIALSPTTDGSTFVCQERASAEYILQPTGYTALAGDATFANGRVAALQATAGGNVFVEWFGALGVGDDTVPTQNAVDRMTAQGGGNVYAFGYYTTTDTIEISGGGVSLFGTFPKNVFSATVSINDRGVIHGSFTSGPVVLLSDTGCAIENITLDGSTARRAATITTGGQALNSGLLVEGPDVPGDILQSVRVVNVRCVNQPADAISIEGDVTNIAIINTYGANLGRHGISVSDGAAGGRNHKAQCGIVMIEGGKHFDCGGHGLAIGHPNSTQFPYRVTVNNWEGYRLALDAGQRYTTAGNWIVCQNSVMSHCAWGGTTTGNVSDHEGLTVGGRDVRVVGCRYIGCQTNYVDVIQQAGFSTETLKIDGGKCSTNDATAPPYFAALAAGVDGVHITGIDHDGANPVTDIPVAGTNSDILLQELTENKTVHYNHTQDFSGSTVTGLKADGSSDTDILAGAVTVTKEGYYKLDTEGNASTDTLTTITGGNDGEVIVVSQANSSRVITISHGAGNIRLSGTSNFTFTSTSTYMQMMKRGPNWYQIAPAVDSA